MEEARDEFLHKMGLAQCKTVAPRGPPAKYQAPQTAESWWEGVSLRDGDFEDEGLPRMVCKALKNRPESCRARRVEGEASLV